MYSLRNWNLWSGSYIVHCYWKQVCTFIYHLDKFINSTFSSLLTEQHWRNHLCYIQWFIRCGNMQVVRTSEYIAIVEGFIFKSNCTRNRLKHLSKCSYLIRIGFYNVRKSSYIPSHDHNVRMCGTVKKQVTILWNDDVCYALYQHSELDLYCTIMSLTQKSTDVTPFGHTVLTARQQALSYSLMMHS